MEKETSLKNTATKEESELKKNCFRILKGSCFAMMISAICLLIYALLLVNTNLSENTMVPVVLTITGISILIGSSISSRKIKKNGLLNGAAVGLIYILILYCTSSICLTGFSLTSQSLIMLLVGILTGAFGGMLGVNIK